MDRFTEIPIIGGLFEVIAVYLRLTGAIIRRPFAFARQTDFADPREPRQALRYLLASVVVS
ncbi:MAG: hypothetical protein HY355_03875, partial [Armatimonadetes bacterium]|nr:hypothetical protein [Armatimonadota bacterium]